MKIPDDITNIIHEYIERNGKRPNPFNHDKWDSFEQYKEYLKKELENNTANNEH